MKHLILVLSLAFTVTAHAQKIKLIQGSLAPLKEETSLNTEFVYEGMVISKKQKPEKEYIAEKKADYNAKEPGRGDKWETAWYDDRKSRFEPQFRELFSKHSDMSTVNEKAKYTLIYKTTMIEPGFNVGVMRRPAFTDAEITIVETGNRNNVIAKITLLASPGSQFGGFDYDTGVRIAESFAKAGKELGGFIKKNKNKK